MKKYNPNIKQFIIKDKDFLKSPMEEIEGYVPKMFVKHNKETGLLEQSNNRDFEYLLKFSHDIVSSHSENEHFFIWLSQQCDIKTSNAFLIKENPNDDNCDKFILLSEKFTNEDTNILHLKDILSAQERKGVTLGRIYQIIDELPNLVKDKREDIKLEIFKQVLFSNSIGNYDLNYGNMAFLTNSDYQIIDIAPAYDLTTTYIFDSYKKSNIIINSKNLDVTASDIIKDSMPYIDNTVLFDTVANMTFKLNDNFKEIKNSYIPQISELNGFKEIDILSNFYVEDELKDTDMILTYKHIQNKIHSLNNICRDNGYIYSFDNKASIIDEGVNNLPYTPLATLTIDGLKDIANDMLDEHKKYEQQKSTNIQEENNLPNEENINKVNVYDNNFMRM